MWRLLPGRKRRGNCVRIPFAKRFKTRDTPDTFHNCLSLCKGFLSEEHVALMMMVGVEIRIKMRWFVFQGFLCSALDMSIFFWKQKEGCPN